MGNALCVERSFGIIQCLDETSAGVQSYFDWHGLRMTRTSRTCKLVRLLCDLLAGICGCFPYLGSSNFEGCHLGMEEL